MLRPNERRAAERFYRITGGTQMPIPRDRLPPEHYAKSYAAKLEREETKYDNLERDHIVDLILRED